jgi:hypothetical protein
MANNKTKIILYAKEGDHCGDVFNNMIIGLAPKENIELYSSISELSSRLRRPQCESIIVVLLISDGEDLKRIITVRSLFDNIRIILVLPDSNIATVKIGHSLHPRYLSFTDGSLGDVVSVLARMIESEKMQSAPLSRGPYEGKRGIEALK